MMKKYYFCGKKYLIQTTMLGFDSKRTLVKGQFAREIRARIRRIQTKQLNEADRREIQSHKKYANGMSIEWQ